MGKMGDSLTTDTVCVVCLAEVKAKAEGLKAWSVSISGQALCGYHNDERLQEMD